MSGLDATDLRVQSILYRGALDSYRAPAEHVLCAACGAHTNTRDGYPVPTPLGDVWACERCNRDPACWDPAEVFFIGATRGGNNG